MKKIIVFISIFFFFIVSLKSQNEIGISNSMVYLLKEKNISYGLDLHYLYNIPKSKFGIGLFYEKIFNEDNENTFGLLFSYKPIEHISLNLSPGLSNSKFSTHIEGLYDFEIGKFDMGPVMTYSIHSGNDNHIGLGIHFCLKI